MNAKSLFIAVTAAALLSAFGQAAVAEERDPDYQANFVSTKTRAEVRTELVAARAAGLIRYGEAAQEPVLVTGSSVSRAQVAAEAREAMRLGLFASHGDQTVVPTAEQLERIRQAGLRAVSLQLVAN